MMVWIAENEFPQLRRNRNHTLQCHFQLLLLLISEPITPDKTLASKKIINPPFWTKSLRLLLKLILGHISSRKWFLYFFNLLSSSFVNFLFHSTYLMHPKIAFTSSSSADASNARLACGLTSLKTCRKCSCDCNRFITLYRCKNLAIFSRKNLCSKS